MEIKVDFPIFYCINFLGHSIDPLWVHCVLEDKQDFFHILQFIVLVFNFKLEEVIDQLVAIDYSGELLLMQVVLSLLDHIGTDVMKFFQELVAFFDGRIVENPFSFEKRI
jgi:hypothetical protein